MRTVVKYEMIPTGSPLNNARRASAKENSTSEPEDSANESQTSGKAGKARNIEHFDVKCSKSMPARDN